MTAGRPRVFLSAGVPWGERALRYEPFNAEAITDAAVWIARILLRRGARLVFGAQPAISPVILSIAADAPERDAVEIFQSERFRPVVPPETLELARAGHGHIEWVDGTEDEPLQDSIGRMRDRMLDREIVAGVFIGGMNGIEDEFERFGTRHAGRPRYVITGPGGAARKLLDRLRNTDASYADGAYPDYGLEIADGLGLPGPRLHYDD